MDLNLNDENNRKFLKMITNEKIEDVQDEIEAQVFLFAKKLKRTKLARGSSQVKNAPGSTPPTVPYGILTFTTLVFLLTFILIMTLGRIFTVKECFHEF